jgi:PAS domain S-box-containing protein
MAFMDETTSKAAGRNQEASGVERDSAADLVRLISRNADGMLVVDLAGSIRFVNPAAEELLGREAAVLIGEPFGNVSEADVTEEIELLHNQGLPRIAEMRVVGTTWCDQPAFVVSLRDVTARKRQEQWEKCARTVLAHLNEPSGLTDCLGAAMGVIRKDLDLEVASVGLAQGADLPSLENCHDEGYESVLLLPLRCGGEVLGLLQLCDRRPDRFVRELVTFLEGLGLSIGTAISRRLAEESRRKSEERFRVLFEKAADCIFLLEVSPEGIAIVRDLNTAASRILGYEPDEVTGRPFDSLVAKPSGFAGLEVDQLLVGAAADATRETRIRCKDRSFRDFEGSLVATEIGDTVHVIAVLRDITERKRAEEERQRVLAKSFHSQRLEAIGTLASGVAHEINNPLNIVMNYADLIREAQDRKGESCEWADAILNHAERMATIVRSLLAFSRRDEETLGPDSLAHLVSSTLSLVAASFRKDGVELVSQIDAGLPSIRCHAQQIQQVIMNLLTNAHDAVISRYPGESPDKVVFVRAQPFDREGGSWIRLTVEDRGIGVAPENAPRLFEPFFSTKPRHAGTGLGLSISYGIVKEHCGEIWFESERGTGTRFHVELPVDKGTRPPVGCAAEPLEGC